MLINLSNHSQEFWDNAQMRQAIDKYESVIDVPFPNVLPIASCKEIEQQAKDLFERLKSEYGHSATVFHIMGEMTLTFHLVNLLKAAGYTCVASTSERKVSYTEDGTKNVVFKFVRFREY